MFIIWFCCFLSCNERKRTFASNEQVRKSIKETQLNLNQIGIELQNDAVNKPNVSTVEDYTYLNREEVLPQVNQAFIHNEVDLEADQTPKCLSVLNQPKLTREQIEKEFQAYSVAYRKRLNELNMDSQTSNTACSSLDTIEYVRTRSTRLPNKKLMGTYSHNFQVRKKNRVAKITAAFKQTHDDLNNTQSSIQIFKFRPRKSQSEQIWQI